MPTCRPVDINFVNTAPVVIVNTVEINAPAESIFSVFEDEHAWPQWFDDIKSVDWTTPKPYGIGTTRTVNLGALSVDEYFFLWEDNARFAFYFTQCSLPLFKALMEDYRLEEIGNNKTRFTYTVAYEPALPLAIAGPLGKLALKRNFKKAANGLVQFMETR